MKTGGNKAWTYAAWGNSLDATTWVEQNTTLASKGAPIRSLNRRMVKSSSDLKMIEDFITALNLYKENEGSSIDMSNILEEAESPSN